jgi:sugar phosphate isomerase/epimerase
MRLTMGCTTRPFRDLPFDEACSRIAAAGYTDVAIFTGITPDSSREDVLGMRQTAVDAGLEPSMLLARAPLDLGLEPAIAAYKQLVDHAVTLGAAWLLDLGTSQEVYLGRYVALMKQVAPYAALAGIGISVKPHGGITRTSDDLITLCSQVNHPAFRVCYDPGNLIYYTQGADVMITPGEGWVDFYGVLSGLVGSGFRGPLYLETVGGETIDEIERNAQGSWHLIAEILARMPEEGA